jgi:hypothetical protein
VEVSKKKFYSSFYIYIILFFINKKKFQGYYEEEKGEVDSKIRQVNAMSGLILQQEYAESLNSNAEGEVFIIIKTIGNNK